MHTSVGRLGTKKKKKEKENIPIFNINDTLKWYFGYIGLNKILISPVSFYLDTAARKFKITFVVCILFLLGDAAIE